MNVSVNFHLHRGSFKVRRMESCAAVSLDSADGGPFPYLLLFFGTNQEADEAAAFFAKLSDPRHSAGEQAPALEFPSGPAPEPVEADPHGAMGR